MRKLARAFAATLLNNVELELVFGEARDDGLITEDEMDDIQEELIKIADRLSIVTVSADTHEMVKQVVEGGI